MSNPILVPAWIAVLSLGVPRAVGAQTPETPSRGTLSIGISIGTIAFSGAARGAGEDGEQLLFIPYRPTMFGIRLGYGRDALRLEGAVAVGEPGLAIRGAEFGGALADQGVLLVVENAFRVRALSWGASAPLLTLTGGPVLRLRGAALVERWTSPDAPSRTVAGGEAGLAAEVTLTGSLVGRAEAMLGLTPASPFRAEDLPEGFRQNRTWRRSVSVVVSWRL